MPCCEDRADGEPVESRQPVSLSLSPRIWRSLSGRDCQRYARYGSRNHGGGTSGEGNIMIGGGKGEILMRGPPLICFAALPPLPEKATGFDFTF